MTEKDKKYRALLSPLARDFFSSEILFGSRVFNAALHRNPRTAGRMEPDKAQHPKKNSR